MPLPIDDWQIKLLEDLLRHKRVVMRDITEVCGIPPEYFAGGRRAGKQRERYHWQPGQTVKDWQHVERINFYNAAASRTPIAMELGPDGVWTRKATPPPASRPLVIFDECSPVVGIDWGAGDSRSIVIEPKSAIRTDGT